MKKSGGPREKVISEAVQAATLALKIAEMFEKQGEQEQKIKGLVVAKNP